MADLLETSKRQSLIEIRVWDFDFTPDMKAGVTVASATATHVPPSGTASTPTVGNIVSNVVPVTLGPLTITGRHLLHVIATLSDSEKSEMRLEIQVDF